MDRAWGWFRGRRWWIQALLWVVAGPIPFVVFAFRNPPSSHGVRKTLAVVSAFAWAGSAVALVGSVELDEAERDPLAIDARTTTTERQSGITVTTVPSTSTTARPAPEGGTRGGAIEVVEDGAPTDAVERGPGANSLLATLSALRVAPEEPRAGYERSLFPHWDDDDGDGCDTRCEVLSSQRRADGTWLSPWDGATAVDASEVEIDHVVALSEAWDSGASGWRADQRDRFADDRSNLLAVTAAANRRKSDKDASEWFPSSAAANCLWASTVVRVKHTWDLAIDPSERDALANLLRTCEDYRPPTTTTTSTTTTRRPPPPPPPAGGDCDPAYPDVCIPSPPPDLDCGEIPHRRFRVVEHPDPHGFDGDGDGIGCESG